MVVLGMTADVTEISLKYGELFYQHTERLQFIIMYVGIVASY
jgi:hypothetical protein